MLVPVPFVVIFPGDLVRVHEPEAGNPFSSTLPVGTEQVGWVMVPTTGAPGTPGIVAITTLLDATEEHPELLVTLKV